MRAPAEQLRVAAAWGAKADHDLIAAKFLLKMKRNCPTDTICYHAQQAVEKYLKGGLVAHGIDFPRTHDIETLAALLPVVLDTGISLVEQRRLPPMP